MDKETFIKQKTNEINEYLFDKEAMLDYSHPLNGKTIEDIEEIHENFKSFQYEINAWIEKATLALEEQGIINFCVVDAQYQSESDLEVRAYLPIGTINGRETRESVIMENGFYAESFTDFMETLAKIEYDIQSHNKTEDEIEYIESDYKANKRKALEPMPF